MLTKTLQFTNDVLDQYYRNKFALEEKSVVLNDIINNDGSIPEQNQNKVVLSLINLEKETQKQFYNRTAQLKDGQFSDINPSERFNLDILMTANFDEYTEALKFLNGAISFFQTNTLMDAAKYSNFPTELVKIEFEMERTSYQEMQNLWSSMGAKYRPSVIYKLRLITVQENNSEGFIPEITQTKEKN